MGTEVQMGTATEANTTGRRKRWRRQRQREQSRGRRRQRRRRTETEAEAEGGSGRGGCQGGGGGGGKSARIRVHVVTASPPYLTSPYLASHPTSRAHVLVEDPHAAAPTSFSSHSSAHQKDNAVIWSENAVVWSGMP